GCPILRVFQRRVSSYPLTPLSLISFSANLRGLCSRRLPRPPGALSLLFDSLTLSLFHSLTLSYLCDLCVLPSVNSVLPSLFLFSANLCVWRLPRPGRGVIFSFSELFNLFFSCLLIVDNLQHRSPHQLR